MQRETKAALLALLVCAVVLWLVFLSWWVIVVQGQRIRALEAVSVGMPRQLVIEKLGPPKRARPDDEYVKGGELLIYDRLFSKVPEYYVVLDKTGHVAMIIYPFINVAPR